MKKIAFLLLFIVSLCNTALYAQLYTQKELDSLEKRLGSHQNQDSIKLELMNDLIFEYAYSSPKKGLALADQAIKLGSQLKLYRKLSATYNYKALCYANIGDDFLAVTTYNISLQNSKKYNLTESYASTLNNLAILYTNQGKYKEGLKLRQEALKIFQQLGNMRKTMLMLQNIGVSYFYLGNYSAAIKHYNNARLYSLKINDVNNYSNTITNIALCYTKLDQPKLALKYYQEALAVAYKNDLFELQVNTLNNLGNLHSDMQLPAQAIQYYTKAIAKAKEIGNTRGLLNAYTNMANLYLKQEHDYEKAYLYFNKAEKISKITQNNQAIAQINNGLATILLKATDEQLTTFGFNYKQKLTTAEQYGIRALASATETESPENMMHANEILSHIHQSQGKHKLALIEFKKYAELKDTLFNDEKKIEFVKQEMSFETEKQKLIAHEQLLKEKIVRKQNIFISAIILIALVISLPVVHLGN